MRTIMMAATAMTLGALFACVTDPDRASGSAPPDGPKPAAPSGDAGSDSASSSEQSPATGAAAAHVRRLTNREFRNSVLDIFGDTTTPASFPEDGTDTGFDNDFTNLGISDLVVENIQTMAEGVAAGIAARLPTLLPCSTSAPKDETACAGTFIDTYGRLVYRRALTTEERAALMNVFSFARGLSDFPTAIESVASALLQSPNFIYRSELGDPSATGGPSNVVRLTAYELAAELSYYLWVSAPDDALLEVAESGGLDDDAGVAATVAKMMQDPRAKRSVDAFFVQLLDIENPDAISKSQVLYPTFSATVAESLVGETTAFVDDVVWNRDGTLTTLLTSNKSFANADVAAIYGITGPTGQSFVPVVLDPSERAGFITHPSVVAAHTNPGDTSPILSGKFIREKLFCQILPPPPADVPPLQAPDPSLSTRARFSQHDSDPACSGCHSLMDPIGFGFEQFDAIGRYRTMDGKFPLTGAGELTSTDVDGDFKGPVELAAKLAKSPSVRSCFNQSYFQYALGRQVDTTIDQGAVTASLTVFTDGNTNIRALISAIATSDAFKYRQPADKNDGGM